MSNQQRTHTRIPDEPPKDRREWSMFHYRLALERAEKRVKELEAEVNHLRDMLDNDDSHDW